MIPFVKDSYSYILSLDFFQAYQNFFFFDFLISDRKKSIYWWIVILWSRKKKLSDCLLSSNFESIDKYYRGTNVLNQLSKLIKKKIIRKKMKWNFWKHRKSDPFCRLYIYEQNRILWLLRTQRGPIPRIRQRNKW